MLSKSWGKAFEGSNIFYINLLWQYSFDLLFKFFTNEKR